MRLKIFGAAAKLGIQRKGISCANSPQISAMNLDG